MPPSLSGDARRVVITGGGAICALGKSLSEFWDSVVNCRSGIRRMKAVDPAQFRFENGAEVQDYNGETYFEGKIINLLDRFSQFAVIAAREAIRDSGIELTDELRARTAIVTGCAVGGQCTMDDGFVDLYQKSLPRVNPFIIPRVMGNSGASHISMEFGITGPTYNISTACSSSNHAIGQAFWLVRSGIADMALTGGSDAVFSFGMLKSWEAMRVIAPDTCRPFSKDRRGLILGEGAGMLVLETLESARRRGARIYAEIAGFGMSSDAHHITQPSATGAASAMTKALDDGGIALEDVGYINAHGTGTTANDCTETAAIQGVFGSRGSEIPVSSTKSLHGHALGASGALEAAASILGLHHGVLPPTANFNEPDPACNLNLVVNQPREARPRAALSNSFAFGGLNAVLAFRSM